MATLKNSKSSKASAPKSKSSKASPLKKSTPKASSKGKVSAKSASSSKSKTVGKAKKVASIVRKAAPAKKAASKATSKQVLKKKPIAKKAPSKSKVIVGKQAKKVQLRPASASKAISKPVDKAKAKVVPPSKSAGLKVAKPASIIQSKAPALKKPAHSFTAATAKSKEISRKPVLATPSGKVKPHMHTFKPQIKSVHERPIVAAAKPSLKPAGSKISDLAKPSVSSRPMAEKHKEQPKPVEFQRKSLKQNTVHTVKPFDTMSDKKEIKPVGATYSDEPHKTRYNDKELEEFDQLIDQKLIVAREQLEFYLKQLEDMAENPDNKIKGLDDGLSTLESERVSSMAARQQKLIQHLENAKIRIKNKVYGICRETGRLISKERLRAVPHATLSIEAKQAQN